MALVRPVRPPFATGSGQPSLNWQHPLARGMTDCLLWNALAPINLALPTVQTTLTSSPTLVPTVRGYAGYATGGSSFDIPNHGNISAGDFTIRMIVRIVSWPGAFATLIDKGTAVGGNHRELAIFFDTSGNIDFLAVGEANGAFGIATGLAAGGTYDVVMTRSGLGASNIIFYTNGVVAAGSASLAGTTAVASPLSFGRNASGGGVNADAQFITAQIWNRALSAGEILQLARDPLCFLTYPQDAVRVGVAATAAASYAAFSIPQRDAGTYSQMIAY